MSWIDATVTPDATYKYRIAMRAGAASEVVSPWVEVTTPRWRATSIELAPVQPNPSVGATTLRFAVAERGKVRLVLHDLAGRAVRTLVDDVLDVGDRTMAWDGLDDTGSPVAAGVYFARLSGVDRAVTRKLTYLGAR